MTETDKKTTDTPDKSAEEKNTPEKKVKVKTKKSAASNLGVYTLIFLVTSVVYGGLYLLWENQQQNSIKGQFSRQSINKQIDTLKQNHLESIAQNKKEINKIHTFQDNLRNNLTKIIRNKKHLRNDWLMAEAEYLVQLANHRLLLEKDVTTAAIAIKAADARLAEVADPALLNIRKILTNDLQALKNIPKIDLAGLSLTLSALSNNIPNLPLRTPDPKTHQITQEDKPQASSNINNINELPAAIWRDIKSLIVIRNHQKSVEALLSPEQHFFLVQNLALLLEQSRLALLNGNNEIYQERIQTTENWIKQYFDTEHNITRNMLASIDELQKFDIDPPLPDISSTFSAIKKYRTQGQLPAAPVIKTKEKL